MNARFPSATQVSHNLIILPYHSSVFVAFSGLRRVIDFHKLLGGTNKTESPQRAAITFATKARMMEVSGISAVRQVNHQNLLVSCERTLLIC